MPGGEDETALAADSGPTALDVRLEVLELPDGAGDGVLGAPLVEVDDLEELPADTRDVRDERDDLVVGDTELAGPDRGEPVVAAPQLVSRDEVVHGLAALEDDLEDGLERQDTRAGGEARCTHRRSDRT